MPKLRKSNQHTIDFEDEEECSRTGDKPGQRNAANARERARMRILSKAFSRLKTTLPWVPPDTKLSKLDTLRLATSYIAHLKTILTDENDSSPVVHPLNLTWPFTIQQQPSELAPKNPDTWPLEEHPVNSKSILHVGLVPRNIEHSSTCSETETEEPSKRFRNHFIEHHHHHHHHHYSDSLLNIGTTASKV